MWYTIIAAGLTLTAWAWSLKQAQRIGYDRGQTEEAEGRERYLVARFEDGKRFERHKILTTLELMDMREDRKRALTHKLGLCGCGPHCCCFRED